ncbi:G-protein-coupled receptor family protein [Balamuthia mandrillaris]
MKRISSCLWIAAVAVLVIAFCASPSDAQTLPLTPWDNTNPLYYHNATCDGCEDSVCEDAEGKRYLCIKLTAPIRLQWNITTGVHGVEYRTADWAAPGGRYWSGLQLPDFLVDGQVIIVNDGEESKLLEYVFTRGGDFWFYDPMDPTVLKARLEIADDPTPAEDDDEDGVDVYNNILNWVVLVLLALSVGGAGATILTFTIFRDIRTYPIKLITYLCGCIVCANLFFIFAFEDPFLENNALCFVTGIIVHGFFLACFFWTFCIAFNFYQMIVRRNREPQTLEKWYHLIAWGCPLFCVLFVCGFRQYGDTGSSSACYIGDALFIFLFFFLPGLIIISANTILFFFVAREIHETLASAPKSDKRERNKEYRVYLSIFVSIGLSWAFGFLMIIFEQEVIFLIFLTLFSVTTPLQGFLIFIFYCLNMKVLSKWLGLFSFIPLCKTWSGKLDPNTRGATASGSRGATRSSRSQRQSRRHGSGSSTSLSSAVSTDVSSNSSMATNMSMDVEEPYNMYEDKSSEDEGYPG